MNRRAQNTLEYVVLFSLIAASLFTMQVYVKRALQGKFRNYAAEVSGGGFYVPTATNSVSVITRSITEGSHSYSQDIVVNGEVVKDHKLNISESQADISQTTSRNEEVLAPPGAVVNEER